jgi:F-type H+-transporting ATPase subunit alpha
MKVENQVAIIYAGSKGLLRNVPIDKVKEFEAEYLQQLEVRHPDVLQTLKAGKLDDNVTNTLETVAKELAGKY